jgi:O-antigen/teichoic acid export membrane protein
VLIDQGALSIATFVAGILVARACSQDEYGQYVLGWSIVLMLQGFHRALVNVPFTVHAPRMPQQERTLYMGSALIHTLLLGLAIILTLLAVWFMSTSQLGQKLKLDSLNNLYPLLAIIIIPCLARDFMRNAMLAQLDVSASVFTNMLATILMVASMLTLFTFGELSLAWAFHIYALTSVLAAGYMLRTYRVQTRLPPGRLWSDLRRGWGIGKWITINTLGFMAASQAYPWLLLYFGDMRNVAAFGACLATAGILTPLLRGATAYMLPRMAHANKDGATNQLARVLKLSILILSIPYGVWLLIGCLYGEELVTFFYSDLYGGYELLVSLLLGKTFIESVSAPMTNALQALERAEVTTISLMIGAAVTLGLGPFMIHAFGVTGAGYASVLSSASTATWKWIATRRILQHQHKI